MTTSQKKYCDENSVEAVNKWMTYYADSIAWGKENEIPVVKSMQL